MKEKLIQLATEKGFESHLISYPKSLMSEERSYYLWLCELQKWQEDNNEIYVYPIPYFNLKIGNHHLAIVFKNKDNEIDMKVFEDEPKLPGILPKNTLFPDRYSALETGLYESLKLLP